MAWAIKGEIKINDPVQVYINVLLNTQMNGDGRATQFVVNYTFINFT